LSRASRLYANNQKGTFMSAKSCAQVEVSAARAIETNPLFMMERGLQPPTTLPLHKKSAAVGNLYFEYAQNVPSLRGIVRSGSEIGEYLDSKNLIVLDRERGRYMWKGEPLSKAAFLQMLRPTTPTLLRN
jgi:hypothetical protein